MGGYTTLATLLESLSLLRAAFYPPRRLKENRMMLLFSPEDERRPSVHRGIG
jgi:hypothetical protein